MQRYRFRATVESGHERVLAEPARQAIISTDVNAANLDRVLNVLRGAPRTLVKADGIAFVVRDGDSCVYVEEDAVGPLWKGQRFPLRVCVSGLVITTGQPIVIPDIFADARVPHAAYASTFVRSLAIVPVGPDAALGAYWARQGYTPTDDQLEMLAAIAESAALAMGESVPYCE